MNIGSADTVPVLAQDNIFYGGGTLSTQSNTTFSGNFVGNPSFVSLTNYSTNLNPGSPAINEATSEGVSSEGYSLVPKINTSPPPVERHGERGGCRRIGIQNSGTMLNCLP